MQGRENLLLPFSNNPSPALETEKAKNNCKFLGKNTFPNIKKHILGSGGWRLGEATGGKSRSGKT